MIVQIPQFKLASTTLLAQPVNELFKTISSTIDLSDVAGILINIIENGFFVLLATIFLLYELPKLKLRLTNILGADNPSLIRFLDLTRIFIEYFVIRVKVNLFMAVGASIILIPFGIDFALLWGFITLCPWFHTIHRTDLSDHTSNVVCMAKYGLQGAIAVWSSFQSLTQSQKVIYFHAKPVNNSSYQFLYFLFHYFSGVAVLVR